MHTPVGAVKYVALDEGDKILSPGMQEDCEILRKALLEDKESLPQVRIALILCCQ